MSKLTHKGSEFDAAVRKVRADYADVSNVNATSEDVVSGKVIINANKEIVTGNLGNAQIATNAVISGAVVGDDMSDYPVQATPSCVVSKEGFIDSIADSETQTRYVKVQSKTCTPKAVEQVVTPSSGRLLSDVTVNAASVPPVIEKMYIPTYNLTKPATKTGTYYGAYASSGSKHDNVYCSASNPDKAKVYLFRVGSTINDNNPVIIVDPETKQIPSTTIVLGLGDSITSTGNTYAPAGILTLTTAGRLTFEHTAAFYCMSGSGSAVWLLWINGYYYIPCVDYKVFSHSYNGVGSYAQTAKGFYGGNLNVSTYSSSVTYYKPKTLFANLTNVYFYFYWNGTSNYEKLRLTFNYGTYLGFFIEQEE